MNALQRSTPRSVNECRENFRTWLSNYKDGGCFSDATRMALNEVFRELKRTEEGLFGVVCFCNQPAHVRTIVSNAPSAELVGLCEKHASAAAAAKATLLTMSNAIYEANHPRS